MNLAGMKNAEPKSWSKRLKDLLRWNEDLKLNKAWKDLISNNLRSIFSYLRVQNTFNICDLWSLIYSLFSCNSSTKPWASHHSCQCSKLAELASQWCCSDRDWGKCANFHAPHEFHRDLFHTVKPRANCEMELLITCNQDIRCRCLESHYTLVESACRHRQWWNRWQAWCSLSAHLTYWQYNPSRGLQATHSSKLRRNKITLYR